MPQHQHHPIQASSQIRILSLHPPTTDNPEAIFGELSTLELKEQPAYEALSYCWGTEEILDSVQLPDGHLPITVNLAAGLRQLRLTDQVRRLWVDAICINQHDNVEKGHQVPLMTEIYRNASCVLIWLGVGDSVVYEAIDFLKLTADSSWRYGISKEFLSPTIYGNTLERKTDKELKALQELGGRTDASILQKFFDQPWFERLWVVQEFVLASKFTVYNGGYTISGDDLTVAIKVLWHLKDIPGPYMSYLQVYQRAMRIFQSREYIQYPPEKLPPLYVLVEENCFRKRVNDLDIIYGIMGLVFEPSDIELTVDYEIEVEELFITFVKKYFEKGIISVLPRGEVFEERHMFHTKLPSWVPDYRVLRRANTVEHDLYSAATALNPGLTISIKEPRILRVRGTFVDTINIVSQFPIDHGERFMIQDLQSYINETRSLYNKLLLSSGNGDRSNITFARLVVSDCRQRRQMAALKSSDPEYLLSRLLDFEDFGLEKEAQLPSSVVQSLEEYGSDKSRVIDYVLAIRANLIGSSIIFTEVGHIAFGARFAKPGDKVVVFDGAEKASILRPVEMPVDLDVNFAQDNERKWRLVGECYLQGFMDNEVLDSVYDDKRQTFLLV